MDKWTKRLGWAWLAASLGLFLSAALVGDWVGVFLPYVIGGGGIIILIKKLVTRKKAQKASAV